MWGARLRNGSNARDPAWRVEALAAALSVSDRHRAIGRVLREALIRYEPQPYDGRVVLIRPRMRPGFNAGHPTRGWGPLVRDLTTVTVPANHLAMLEPPHVAHVAAVLERALESGAITAAGPGSS
jgi:thioesterase domain-containing protein